jgi:hypothetical protein
MEKSLMITFSEEKFFTVYCDGAIAEQLNFEEMLGCVIRKFAEQQGNNNYYFRKPERPFRNEEPEQEKADLLQAQFDAIDDFQNVK